MQFSKIFAVAMLFLGISVALQGCGCSEDDVKSCTATMTAGMGADLCGVWNILLSSMEAYLANAAKHVLCQLVKVVLLKDANKGNSGSE